MANICNPNTTKTKTKNEQINKARIAAGFGMPSPDPLLESPSSGWIVAPDIHVPEIHPFELDPNIKSLVGGIANSCKTDLECYNSIFLYISSLTYGRDASNKEDEKSKFIFKTATETFEDGYGNCASRTNLFIAMVNALREIRKTSLIAFYAISEDHYLHKDKDFLHAFPAVFICGSEEEVPEEYENADFQFKKSTDRWRKVLEKLKMTYSPNLHLLCGDTLQPHPELYHPIILTNDEARAAYYSNAHTMFKRNRARAEAYLRKAILVAPTYWSSYFNLGLLLKKKNRTEAKELFKKTLELHPKHRKAIEQLKSLK